MKPVTHTHPETGLVVRSKVRRSTPCGKQGYTSKKHAKYVANVESKRTGEDIRPYHCFGCHCYHVGHPPKPFDFEAERAKAS